MPNFTLTPVGGDPFSGGATELDPAVHPPLTISLAPRPFDPEGTGPANYAAQPLPGTQETLQSLGSGHAADDYRRWADPSGQNAQGAAGAARDFSPGAMVAAGADEVVNDVRGVAGRASDVAGHLPQVWSSLRSGHALDDYNRYMDPTGASARGLLDPVAGVARLADFDQATSRDPGLVPKSVANSVYSGLTLPGDVAMGRVDPLSEEGRRRVFDTLGLMGGAGLPMAEEGALGAMGGRGFVDLGTGERMHVNASEARGWAQTFDKQAADLQAAGGDPTKISQTQTQAQALRDALPHLDSLSPATERPSRRRELSMPVQYDGATVSMTRSEVAQRLESLPRTLARLRASGDTAGIAEAENTLASMREALPKLDAMEAAREPYDPTRPGLPFAPAKIAAVGDRAVSVATDPRHNPYPDNWRTYRVYPQPEEGLDGVTRARDLGSPLGYAQMKQRDDGRWEVGMVNVKPSARGQGVARDLYSGIEADLGQKMQPSGILMPDGYAMWQRRDPQAVQFHQPVQRGDGTAYHVSPRWLQERAGAWAESDPAFDASMRAAMDRVPPEGRTPEALNAMFARGAPGGPALAGQAPPAQPDTQAGMLAQLLRQGAQR